MMYGLENLLKKMYFYNHIFAGTRF